MAKRRSTGMRLIGELMQLRIDEHDTHSGELNCWSRASIDGTTKGLGRTWESRRGGGSALPAAPALRGSVLDLGASPHLMSSCPGLMMSDLVYLDAPDELVSGADSLICTSTCDRESKSEVEQVVGCMSGIFSRLKRRLTTRSMSTVAVEYGEQKLSSFIKSSRTKNEAIDKNETSDGRLQIANRGIAGIPEGRRSRRHHRTASMRARCDMIESFWTEPINSDHLKAVHRRCISWDESLRCSVYKPSGRATSLNKKGHIVAAKG